MNSSSNHNHGKKIPPSKELRPEASTTSKAELARSRERIHELQLKVTACVSASPDKAAKILTDWLNQPASKAAPKKRPA